MIDEPKLEILGINEVAASLPDNAWYEITMRIRKPGIIEIDQPRRVAAYRVFIGLWDDDGDHDVVSFDMRNLSWQDARDEMQRHFAFYKDDACEVCRVSAFEESKRLAAASEGRFEAEVDGFDYLIIPE